MKKSTELSMRSLRSEQLKTWLIIFSLVAVIPIYSCRNSQAAGPERRIETHLVKRFGAGIYKLDKIESGADFLKIEGEGSGISILEVPGGIVLTGKEPRLRGFTLKGKDNKGVGITLKNNGRVIIEDIEIQGYQLGLLSLCTYGHRQWLHTYRDLYVYEGENGMLKSYDKHIRGVELLYEGKKTKQGRWIFPGGGFSNTHTFYGGRIAVPGTPLLIDGPTSTSMFGTYIDMSAAPVRMTTRSAGLQLFGVTLDRGPRARKYGIPAMVLENPKYNRVRMYGDNAYLVMQGFVVDGKGKPLTTNQVQVWPPK